jgi:hypothetical protein
VQFIESLYGFDEQMNNRIDMLVSSSDDSGGYVGDVYQECAVLWLQAAAQVSDEGQKKTPNWIEKIKEFVANNDYALYDNLLPNVDILLNQDELRQLAFYYETE